MALTFPTIAQQAITAFRAQTKTTPFTVYAKQFNGTRDDTITDHPVYYFPDDTTAHTRGAGRGYRIWPELP